MKDHIPQQRLAGAEKDRVPRVLMSQRPARCVLLVVEVIVLFLALWNLAITYKDSIMSALFLTASSSHAASLTTFWSGWTGGSHPWQWPGPSRGSAGYWFRQTQDVVATLQSTYYNGTYWDEYPEILQWAGAVTNTIFGGTQRTFTQALFEYDGDVPGARTSAAVIQTDIRKYYSQIEHYYGSEDTNQIFDAAYDDAQWVVLEWLEAIKFVNQYDAYAESSFGQDDIAFFAHRAHIFYNIVQDKFNTSLCDGGLTWDPKLATYKNAITNELFVSSSIAMYLYYPGNNITNPYPSLTYSNRTLPPLPSLAAHDPLLLENARQEWAWFKSHNFTNAQGLIVDGFHISENQTTCNERNEMVYSYNQGTMLSGLRGLWEATGDISYLQDGYDMIDIVINATGWNSDGYGQDTKWAGLGRAGIMEDYCDASANCSQDNLIFKGVYFQHLDLFCEPLPTDTPLVAGLTKIADADLAANHDTRCKSYRPWIEHNAWAALSTRDATGIMGEWWGAAYLNKTQTPALRYAHPKPWGSQDIWNEPELLDTPLWKCHGGWGGCTPGSYARRGKRASRLMRQKRAARGQVPDVRTAETQVQGLAVVKAAANGLMNRKSYADYVNGGDRD